MTGCESLPLSGIRVVELGNIVAAPFASVLLADLGAEVVKVERPKVGDIVRNTGESGESIIAAYNRNKRSVEFNLKTEDGREAYHELVSESDIVVENLGPAVVNRLGIGYDDLRTHNPELVYLSIKGFFEGPYGARPGMDMVAESMSGLVGMTGRPDERPVRVGTSVADIGAALYGVVGTLIALRERDRTGEGQRVSAGLFESASHWMSYWVTYADLVGHDHPPLGSSHPAFALYDIFETETEAELVFVGVTTDRHWPAFCRALDRIDLLADERFDTATRRLDNQSELVSIVQDELHGWERDTIIDVLTEEGVPAAPVNRPSDLLDDDHLRETGLLSTVSHPSRAGRPLRTLITPIRGSRISTEQRFEPPSLGEHTREVLSEVGYDEQEISDLFQTGAVGSGPDEDSE